MRPTRKSESPPRDRLTVVFPALLTTVFAAVALISLAWGGELRIARVASVVQDPSAVPGVATGAPGRAPDGASEARPVGDENDIAVATPISMQAAASLEERVAASSGGLVRGDDGAVVSVFGFSPAEARELLFPVTKERGLSPSDYRPRDLTQLFGLRDGVYVRAAALPSLQEMQRAANAAGLSLLAVSGFRSYATQAALYDARVRDRLAQGGAEISVEEARWRANQGTALPGFSQHQLGTAIDFSTAGLGSRVTPAFADTATGQWLREHAWEFGFVFPYTTEGRDRTGYIAEPWHLRWVGKPLAAFLMADGYLGRPDTIADDYLEALDDLLRAG